MTARFDPLSYPILFTAPRTLSSVSGWFEHIPFAWLVVRLSRPATLVELGTHFGDSYLAFCQGVAASKLDTRCRAVA